MKILFGINENQQSKLKCLVLEIKFVYRKTPVLLNSTFVWSKQKV